MNFELTLHRLSTYLEQAYIPLWKRLQWNEELQSHAQYALSGGKGVRPSLCWYFYRELSGEISDYPSEALIEWSFSLDMIHAYSLIHDDLPCMDNDDFRRGRPTLHRILGEAKALLIGDALLNGAFENLTLSHALSDDQKLKALKTLSIASGARGMIAGQWHDMFCDVGALSDLEYRHRLKTGALFSAALEMASYFHRASEDKRHHDFSELGFKLGYIFQLKDDYLDKMSEQSTIGKSVGKDERQNKQSAWNFFKTSEDFDRHLEKMSLEIFTLAEPYLSKPNFMGVMDYFLKRNK